MVHQSRAHRRHIQAKTVKRFEILLDRYWEKQGVKYDHNEEIKTGSHKKFILEKNEVDADIVVERPASTEVPKSILK